MSTQADVSTRNLVAAVLVRAGVVLAALMLVLFGCAGTWAYWQAWVYLAVLYVPLTGAMTWLLRNDRGLLERRMHLREREPGQRRLLAWGYPFFLLMYALPGLDHRFGWSDVPVWVVLAADLGVLAGYLVVLTVFRANSYASRTVEVAPGQQLVSTGPYAVVRHPMYVGVLLLYGLSPLALGSWWAMLAAVPVVWVIVARIGGEEAVLRRDLPGYVDYTGRVRYRLIPGVW